MSRHFQSSEFRNTEKFRNTESTCFFLELLGGRWGWAPVRKTLIWSRSRQKNNQDLFQFNFQLSGSTLKRSVHYKDDTWNAPELTINKFSDAFPSRRATCVMRQKNWNFSVVFYIFSPGSTLTNDPLCFSARRQNCSVLMKRSGCCEKTRKFY